MFADLYRNKRVFLTGHTGFKGSWLAEWLLLLGADVTGYSIRVKEGPDHFTSLGLDKRIRHIIGDVRDSVALEMAMREARPEYVFHLAAQPLVRLSYREPVETFTTNIIGTTHVLDGLRRLERPVAAVVVTSDKCYENREWLHGYREGDALGGHDPYSASKGCAEIVARSFRRSFFDRPQEQGVALATARAGNVIGGGDWAEDRIVPDFARSLIRGEPIAVRNPAATRPWQHVLEPLSGYLWLGALLQAGLKGELQGLGLPMASSLDAVCGAFNFGPWPEANRSVGDLVTEMLRHWPGQWREVSEAYAPHESGLLSLAIDKAFHILGWWPVWSFAQNARTTATWYRRTAAENQPALEQTRADIMAFMSDAARTHVRWAVGGA